MTLPHNIHLYYHKDANAEYGSFLDRQMDGTWPRCTGVDGKKCPNYAHPDFDRFCPQCALADANDFLGAVLKDEQADQYERDDAADMVLYAESAVLYPAASPEMESDAWDLMMRRRERIIKY